MNNVATAAAARERPVTPRCYLAAVEVLGRPPEKSPSRAVKANQAVRADF